MTVSTLTPAPRIPLWVIACAVVFWGWGAGQMAVAAPLALLVLGPNLLVHRFEFTRAELHRAGDVCWVMGFGGLMLIYSQESVGNVLRTFVQWLPAVMAPAVVVQIWSARGLVPISAVLPLPGWRRREGDANPLLDLGPVFAVVCLLSASTAGGGREGFFWGAFAVITVVLWVRRARGTPVWAAVALLVAAGVGGWFVAGGLAVFQQWIETGMIEWTTRFQRERMPGRESRTAMGRTGRVGGSSEIVLRIRDEGPRPMPTLLRMAGFSMLEGPTWSASPGGYTKVEPLEEEWVLDPEARVAGAIQYEWARSATRGFAPLPGAVRSLRELVADGVDRTPLGSVHVDADAGIVSFRAEHALTARVENDPVQLEAEIRGIPEVERGAIEAVVEELNLKGLGPEEVLARVREFFRTSFRYTTDLEDTPTEDPRARTPLGRFLLGHRSGHCEFFASAGVLILRAVGIPARYTTGFLVDPDKRQGDLIIVRESQAHAWVRYFKDGTWRDYDPTPPTDSPDEAESTSWWGRMKRSWYEARFALARWWWLGEKPILRQAYWLTVPLLAGLLWRFRRLRSARAPGKRTAGDYRGLVWPGRDSEWFEVEVELARRGLSRREHEPLGQWQSRLAAAGWSSDSIARALEAVRLHERLRFDPRGLRDPERERLKSSADTLLRGLMSPAGLSSA